MTKTNKLAVTIGPLRVLIVGAALLGIAVCLKFGPYAREVKTNSRPNKESERRTHFGHLTYGESSALSLSALNESSRTWVVLKTTASCGCTAAEAVETEIPPGERLLLSATVSNDAPSRGISRKAVSVWALIDDGSAKFSIKWQLEGSMGDTVSIEPADHLVAADCEGGFEFQSRLLVQDQDAFTSVASNYSLSQALANAYTVGIELLSIEVSDDGGPCLAVSGNLEQAALAGYGSIDCPLGADSGDRSTALLRFRVERTPMLWVSPTALVIDSAQLDEVAYLHIGGYGTVPASVSVSITESPPEAITAAFDRESSRIAVRLIAKDLPSEAALTVQVGTCDTAFRIPVLIMDAK